MVALPPPSERLVPAWMLGTVTEVDSESVELVIDA
jgi:hypothetical protein